MTPRRAQMIRDMQLQRLAPKTPRASVAAVAGWAKGSQCSPDRLRPAQRRPSVHHLLVERRLAWSACTHAAAGLKFFSTKTLGWEVLRLDLPPRTGRSQLPRVLSIEELQRLFTRTKHPRHRVLVMTTYAAGRRVSAVVRLRLTAIESDRRLLRVEQGTGRKERYPLRSTRLLTALRASWQGSRPAPWLFPGRDPHTPLPIGTAQTIDAHAHQRAGITHGQGLQTRRHCCATPRLEAGADVWTIQMLRGHKSLATTTRDLQVTRQPLATRRSPFDLLPCGATPRPTSEYRQATARPRLPTSDRGRHAERPPVGRRCYLPPLRRNVPPCPSRAALPSQGEA
jgi:integrase